MRSFSEYNPLVVCFYFFAVAGIAMFSQNPVITFASLIGAICFYLVKSGLREIGSHIFYLAMFVFMALLNPLISHNGATVLLFINDNRVTLEALLYGINASAMIISVIYWFRSFSRIMTSDKLLYVFGFFSPKLALIISMALRYLPLFKAQTKRVNNAQRATGLYKEDSLPDTIKGGSRVFSVMVTWALENGIITADSMSARGYGTGKRTFFSIYRFRSFDAVLLSLTAVFLIAVVSGSFFGALDFTFYPRVGLLFPSGYSVYSYAAYAALAILPTVAELACGLNRKRRISVIKTKAAQRA